MPRIAVLHPFFEVSGGAERKLFIIEEHFRDQFDFTFICFREDRDHCFPDSYRTIEPVSVGYSRNPVGKISALMRMGRAARDHDLIMASNFPSNIAAAYARKRYNIPVIWFCNEPILHLHTTAKTRDPLSLKILQSVERLLMRRVDLVVANSLNTADFIRRTLRLDAELLYDGVDDSLFQPGSNLSLEPEFLFFISRIEEHKNVDALLDLMDQVRPLRTNTKLLIAGDGPYLEDLKRKIAARSLADQVQCLGRISESEKIDFFQRCSLVVYPPIEEPLGLIPIEAALCGVPAVAFNSGGCRETIINGETGYLANNMEEFVTYCLKLLGDPTLRLTLGRAARANAISNFTETSMMKNVGDLITKCVSQSPII